MNALQKFCAMKWNEVIDSDYVFKSHSQKHVIQISGKEIGDIVIDTVLIYYNVYDGTPMIIYCRYDNVEENPYQLEGYSLVNVDAIDTEGNPCSDVTYLSNSLNAALS